MRLRRSQVLACGLILGSLGAAWALAWAQGRIPNAAPGGVAAPPAGALPLAPSPPGATVALGLQKVLAGHVGDVWVAVFSPDGQTLATGGNDRILRLWDPKTGAEPDTVKVSGGIRSAAYSPNGRWLAIGCANGAVHIWDVPQSRMIATLKKQTQSNRWVAFAGDGKTLAVAGNDKTLMLYDTATWAPVKTSPAEEEPILCFAYSPDGTTIAVATGHPPFGGPGTVKIVDAATLEELKQLPIRHDVWGVAYSPDGTMLATASQQAPEPVQLWDPATARRLRALRPAVSARRVSFSPDGTALAVGDLSGTIALFDPDTGVLRASTKGHDNFIFGMGFSPDGKTVATASADAKVKLWDVPPPTRAAEKK